MHQTNFPLSEDKKQEGPLLEAGPAMYYNSDDTDLSVKTGGKRI